MEGVQRGGSEQGGCRRIYLTGEKDEQKAQHLRLVGVIYLRGPKIGSRTDALFPFNKRRSKGDVPACLPVGEEGGDSNMGGCLPYRIIDFVVVHLQLRGQGEPTAEQQVDQTAEEPLRDRRKRGRRRRLPQRNLRRPRWTGRKLGRRRALPRALLVIVLNDELGRLLTKIPTHPRAISILINNDVPLPQHLALKHARLALELKHDGQDALQDAQAVEDLLARVALRASALDERRRERGDVLWRRGRERVVRDEVEQPGGDHAHERHDVLGRLEQCPAN